MKTRFSFALLAGLLMIFLVVALLPMSQAPSAPGAASGTPTASPALPPFVPFPTRPQLAESPTSIPLRPTYTSILGETPLTIATATLLPVDTQSVPIATQTLIFFATTTSTPFGGTATPPVPVAFALDETPQACYKGPSPAYIKMETFKIARIVGKDLTEKWWYLLVNKGQSVFVGCWTSDNQVATSGNLANLSVTEPELPQITQVRLEFAGQPTTGAESIQTIVCDGGLTNTSFHFIGHIFTDGPLADLSYVWKTDAPGRFQTRHTPVKSWDTPAQVDLDLPIPAQAGSYSLSLRTTFPTEMLAELRFTVQCK